MECHPVTTQDGYVLGLYHLLQSADACKHCEKRTPTKTVFLMHGLQASSLQFVLYPNASAGYYFLDNGFDVWLGNARGNTFSRNHTSLDPDDPKFWKFSWHEIGYYDLSAMIDVVLAETGQKQLTYVAHSQGGSAVFVLLSERPEYNEKISSVHTMAGAIFLKYSNTWLNYVLPHIDELQVRQRNLKMHVEKFEKKNTFFLT